MNKEQIEKALKRTGIQHENLQPVDFGWRFEVRNHLARKICRILRAAKLNCMGQQTNISGTWVSTIWVYEDGRKEEVHTAINVFWGRSN